MTFLERYSNAVKLWEFTLPTIPAPPRETMIGWLAVYSDSEYESAVIRTPYRLTQGSLGRTTPTNDDIYRLISSQLRDARKAQRQNHRSYDGRVKGMKRIEHKEGERDGKDN